MADRFSLVTRLLPAFGLAVHLAAPAPGRADPGPSGEPAVPTVPALPSSVSSVWSPGIPLGGPVDENEYVVGPGDLFAVTIGAQSTDVVSARVGPEGNLVIPGIVTVHVSGTTLARAKKDIRAALATRYRNVEVGVSLERLRQIEVHVVGNVVKPGTYVATPLDATSQVIEAAGGLGRGASRRNIRVSRRDGTDQRVDLLRYERLGDLDANPPILDGDLIHVPYEKHRVLIKGAVEDPGFYEYVPGETIGHLIDLAGGLTRDARRDTVEMREFVDERRTRSTLVAIHESAGLATPLRDADQVYVRRSPEFQEVMTVTLEGEFRFPGTYGINEGEDTLLDVLREAGGFTEQASLSEALLLRTRGIDKVDLEFERLKLIPVEDMTKSEYAYFKGKSRERKGVVVVDFHRLVAGDESENRLLQDGDRILAPKKRATVTVSGSVAHPGLTTFLPDMKAGYYIERAGGFSSTADRRGARVIKGVTGEWEPLGKAGVIVPGDEIWVPERAERNWWQFTQEAVRFAASIATVYLVIDQATSN